MHVLSALKNHLSGICSQEIAQRRQFWYSVLTDIAICDPSQPQI